MGGLKYIYMQRSVTKQTTIILILVTVFVSVVLGFFYPIPLPEERIRIEAEGTILNIRATGSWKTKSEFELRFHTGQVYLCSKEFVNKYNLREGMNIRIILSSTHGLLCCYLPRGKMGQRPPVQVDYAEVERRIIASGVLPKGLARNVSFLIMYGANLNRVAQTHFHLLIHCQEGIHNEKVCNYSHSG